MAKDKATARSAPRLWLRCSRCREAELLMKFGRNGEVQVMCDACIEEMLSASEEVAGWKQAWNTRRS